MTWAILRWPNASLKYNYDFWRYQISDVAGSLRFLLRILRFWLYKLLDEVQEGFFHFGSLFKTSFVLGAQNYNGLRDMVMYGLSNIKLIGHTKFVFLLAVKTVGTANFKWFIDNYVFLQGTANWISNSEHIQPRLLEWIKMQYSFQTFQIN